jgi:hypothetical protein
MYKNSLKLIGSKILQSLIDDQKWKNLWKSCSSLLNRHRNVATARLYEIKFVTKIRALKGFHFFPSTKWRSADCDCQIFGFRLNWWRGATLLPAFRRSTWTSLYLVIVTSVVLCFLSTWFWSLRSYKCFAWFYSFELHNICGCLATSPRDATSNYILSMLLHRYTYCD